MAAADETILAPLDEAERATLHALLTKITAELPQPTRVAPPAQPDRAPAARPPSTLSAVPASVGARSNLPGKEQS